MPPSKSVIAKASAHIQDLIDKKKLSAGATLGKSSRFYLVKLKYDGIKNVEAYGLTSIGKKGMRNFGWVLLSFDDYGIGGRSGIISLTNKSVNLTKPAQLYSTYIKRFDVTTNVEYYTPLTKYDNAEIVSVSRSKLVIRDTRIGDTWIIKNGDKKADFIELSEYIQNKRTHKSSSSNNESAAAPHTPDDTERSLTFLVGNSDDGKQVFGDFRKSGHFISSGHVGSGHASYDEAAFATYLLRHNSPNRLQFVMIDPKQVQLTPYKGIPHLWRPLAMSPEDAHSAVADLLAEIQRRFEYFEKTGVNTIDEYNAQTTDTLPFIVLLCTEIADLMMINKKFYQHAFNKIWMLGKAVGIHMYIATQRPSEDVLPGEIMGGVSGRLVFSVASAADSEWLLGEPGAEKITEQGRLIFAESVVAPKQEVTAAYVTDDEVTKILESINGA